MDTTSNNEIVKMYNRNQARNRQPVEVVKVKGPSFFKLLQRPAVKTMFYFKATIYLILSLSIALILLVIGSVLKVIDLFVKLPKGSELITLTRPSDKIGKDQNLPKHITGLNRGNLSYGN